MSNHIYVKNELPQQLSVLAAPNPDWQIADVFADAVKLMASTAVVIVSMGTVGDEYTIKQMVRLGIQLSIYIVNNVKIGVDATNYLNDMSETIQSNGININSNEVTEVMKVITENPLSYLNPSAWAAILGGSDAHLTFFSNDRNSICDFNTNSDYSWIARNSDVVRSKYGTISTPDPDAGKHSWADMGNVIGMITQVMKPSGDCKQRLSVIENALSSDSKALGYDVGWNAIVCHTQGGDKWGFSIYGDKIYGKSPWVDNHCYVMFTSNGATGNHVDKDAFKNFLNSITPETNHNKCTDKAKVIMQQLRNKYPKNHWCVLIKKSPGSDDNWHYSAHSYYGCYYKNWVDGFCYVAWCIG